MEIASRIISDPAVHHGAPVIAGTRVPVSLIIGSLAGGMSQAEVMAEYELEKADVQAALTYAAELISATEVISLAEV